MSRTVRQPFCSETAQATLQASPATTNVQQPTVTVWVKNETRHRCILSRRENGCKHLCPPCPDMSGHVSRHVQDMSRHVQTCLDTTRITSRRRAYFRLPWQLWQFAPNPCIFSHTIPVCTQSSCSHYRSGRSATHLPPASRLDAGRRPALLACSTHLHAARPS